MKTMYGDDFPGVLVRCAATSGAFSNRSEAQVRQALQWAQRSYRYDIKPPLPYILDCVTLLPEASYLNTLPERVVPESKGATEQPFSDSYDHWLYLVCKGLLDYVSNKDIESSHDLLSGGNSREVLFQNRTVDLFHYMLVSWQLVAGTGSFPIVSDSPNLIDEKKLYDYWCEPRSGKMDLWEYVWNEQCSAQVLKIAAETNEGESSDHPRHTGRKEKLGIAWSVFNHGSNPGSIVDVFDHHALRYYDRAKTLQLSHAQSSRIRKLKKIMKARINLPVTTSYEEQDPYFGAITLSTLLLEELGEHQIVNNSDPRISSPPASLPPRTLHIHICWGHGHRSISADAKEEGNSPRLNGLVALVLDDLRSHLFGLPLEFHLHRIAPYPDRVDGIRCGVAWRAGGKLPSGKEIGCIFRRPRHFDLFERSQPFSVDNSSHSVLHWYVALLNESDIGDYGFAWYNGHSRKSLSLTNKNTMDEHVSHCVVIDTKSEKGNVFFIQKHTQVDKPVHPCLFHVNNLPRESFLSLRSRMLDFTLDEIEKRSVR